MILEGLITTRNPDGTIRVRPMGPVFSDAHADSFLLRPYEPSGTLDNLLRTGEGVLHVTDNVLLIAQAALKQLKSCPPAHAAVTVEGAVLEESCHWQEFKVVGHRPNSPRHELNCHVLHRGTHRNFWGFNRARHAVLEATILATRIGILPDHEIRAAMVALQLPVEKTAGPVEISAWNLVRDTVVQSLGKEGLPAPLTESAPENVETSHEVINHESQESGDEPQSSDEENPL